MVSNSVKVSIIIPVYNVEDYIRESLYSIINQTLKDIEIIVVNDGSSDTSLQIIQEVASVEPRMKIISTINNGQSIARNIGLYAAVGEYVYFFDSDDLLDYTALEKCYNKCKDCNLDFCFFDADTFSDDNIDISQYNYNRTFMYQDIVYRGVDILKLQLKKGYSCSPCLNLINREFLVLNNLFFYPRVIHEDELFTYIVYLKAERVSFLRESFFHRRLRPNSTMTSSYSIKNHVGYMTVARELYRYSLDPNLTKEIKVLCTERINVLLSSILSSLDKIYTKNECTYIRSLIYKEFSKVIKCRVYLKIKFPQLYELIRKLKRQKLLYK